MSKNSTWILVIIFLALLALLLWMPRLQEVLVKPTATPTPSSVNLYDFLASDISEINVVSSDGKAFDAQRGSDNLWASSAITQTLDSAAIEESLNQFVGTTIVAELNDTSNLAQYGLEEPVDYVLTITLNDGTQHVVRHGEVAPTGRGYYARVGEKVYVLSKYSLGRLLDFVTNPPVLIATPTPVLTP
jgi:hypothetical protein